MSEIERLRAAEAGHHEQMLDAQAGCVPCKLCGGHAVITDAGPGAGYYIACSNSTNWKESKGCLIDERRLGGYAYNVRDWWNRLHTLTALKASSASTPAEDMREAGQFLLDRLDNLDFSMCMDDFAREHAGHVDPAIARFRAAFAALPDTPVDGEGVSNG